MATYDTRRVMLDSGLTALALRGLRDREGHYPFIDRFAARRPSPPRRAQALVAPGVSRWRLTAASWLPALWRSAAAGLGLARVHVRPASSR